ncbi:MAG: hypothetical protein BA861_02775 [Desulfobacterales bacterium S3730MH5]|nr:MAG: hypothetical protein BA861_02775 [Desulfobacterales bacterium S3730MH5]
MDKKESGDTARIEIIEGQIHEVVEEIQQLIAEKVTVKDTNELEALEKRVVQATDRLASLIVGQKVQQSLDSDELKQDASELAKAYPKKLKNQGQRF